MHLNSCEYRLEINGRAHGDCTGVVREVNENGLSLAWPIHGNGLDTYCMQILNMDMSQIYDVTFFNV